MRAWREREGLSVERAAALIGVSAAYLRVIEGSAFVPSPAIAERFERVFGEPLRDLLKPVEIRNIPVARFEVAS